jgi:Uri superfamily endonuclease
MESDVDNWQRAALPGGRGSYVLRMELTAAAEVTVGRFGCFSLAAGSYYYLGSAFGSGGLRARLGRHLQPKTTQHWHIDYLTALMPIREVIFSDDAVRLECIWCRRMAGHSGLQRPIVRFGAGDSGCDGHLFSSGRLRLPAAELTVLLRGPAGDGAPRLARLLPGMAAAVSFP